MVAAKFWLSTLTEVPLRSCEGQFAYSAYSKDVFRVTCHTSESKNKTSYTTPMLRQNCSSGRLEVYKFVQNELTCWGPAIASSSYCCPWTHRELTHEAVTGKDPFASGSFALDVVWYFVCVSGGSHTWSRPVHELITLFGVGRLFANSSTAAREF